MSQEKIAIPDGWNEDTIQNIINVISTTGKKIKKQDFKPTGKIPIVDQGLNLIGGYTDKLACKIDVKSPLVVFGDHTRAIKYIDFEFAPGADGTKILESKETLVPKYFYYFLRSINLQNRGYSRHFKILKNSRIIYPKNKVIQKQIVAKLDHILGELEVKKKQILSLIEQNKQRIDFFEKNWRRYVITKNIMNHPLQKEWNVVTFDDVCSKITYGFTNPMPHVEKGMWLITTKNIINGKINYSNAKKTDLKSFKELLTDKSRPKVGTVLITKDGTLGRVGIVDKENICISQSVGSLQPIQSKISPLFLAFILESSEIQSKIIDDNKQSTIGHIQITKLAKWTFPLPPIQIQKEIIQNIKSAEEKFKDQKIQFEKIKQNYDSKINYINHIQSSVLDLAFSGKLVN